MGIWYFLMLFVGIILLIVAFKNKEVSRSEKIVILSFIFGFIFILLAVFLFLPGSSYIIDQLLTSKN